MQFYADDLETTFRDVFPLPCEVVLMSGIKGGVIVKFKTFYLKIYNDKSQTYTVYGYRYGLQKELICDTVSYLEFRNYASKFTKEDGLQSMCML